MKNVEVIFSIHNLCLQIKENPDSTTYYIQSFLPGLVFWYQFWRSRFKNTHNRKITGRMGSTVSCNYFVFLLIYLVSPPLFRFEAYCHKKWKQNEIMEKGRNREQAVEVKTKKAISGDEIVLSCCLVMHPIKTLHDVTHLTISSAVQYFFLPSAYVQSRSIRFP